MEHTIVVCIDVIIYLIEHLEEGETSNGATPVDWVVREN